MTEWTVLRGDCRDRMAKMDPDSVDAIVCDPPYELPGGFMGKTWDRSGVSFDPATWAAARRVLKPGGHLLAFGGTRTFHRIAVAIEDAGFEVRDTLSWLYGSGFPKSLDVAKAIDKDAGIWRGRAGAVESANPAMSGPNYARTPKGAPATDLARQWEGWGTALKPAHEPVIVARKPADVGYTLRSLVPSVEEQLCRVASFAKTDTPSSEPLRALGFLNIVSSLRECLAAISDPTNTFTTETASALITDLRILRSCLSEITPESTTPDETRPHGVASSALYAASISISVLAKCERLASITADGSAIGWPAEPGSSRAVDRIAGPAWEPIIVARKRLAGTVAANFAAHGVGGLNIDGCRIGAAPGDYNHPGNTEACEIEGTVYGWATYDKKYKQAPPAAGGRWPANVVLDEAAAELLDAQAGERGGGFGVRGELNGGATKWGFDGHGQTVGYGDRGGPSRFYFVAPIDCWLCGGPKHGIMSATHHAEGAQCFDPANTAEPTSTAPAANGSAHAPAPGRRPLGCGASAASSGSPAPSAESSSRSTSGTAPSIAPTPVPAPQPESLAPRVRSAGDLCGSCATAIARSLARMLRGQTPESVLGPGSTLASSDSILTRSLASYAEPLANTGTTPTTASLSILFGYVRAAITESTERPDLAPTRFRYQSKASRAERNAGLDGMPDVAVHRYGAGIGEGRDPNAPAIDKNGHPTVKPISLMRWLVRLVTPPGGLVVDPFAGSGTTGCAAVLEGFRFVGIEQSADYAEIAERRIAHWARMAAEDAARPRARQESFLGEGGA